MFHEPSCASIEPGLDFDIDDFFTGFRDRYGEHHVGRLEEDPELEQYEELLELGHTLGGLA